MNTPDTKNTQNRPSFSCGLYYVRASTGWPMLNNGGNSFENLTWCSDWSVSSLYRSWFTFEKYQTKTIILWYDIRNLAKTAFLSLIHFKSALGSKIVFSSKCQQKEWSSGWTVQYLTIGKVSNDFTVLWLVQKIDHRLKLTGSVTFIWLLVASPSTIPRSFRGKYAASFSVT